MKDFQGKHQFKQDLILGLRYRLIFGVVCLIGWYLSEGL